MRDDFYLAKMKQSGASDELIAAKLGLTPAQVARVWQDLQNLQKQIESSGYLKLQEQWLMICQQYTLLGSSLKFIAHAINNGITPTELRETIESCPKDTDLASYLMGKFIILQPYPAVQSPEEDLKETLTAKNN